jgi:sugar lactone lactonase YvrE
MALYSSHRIIVFDPDGKPLKDIVFPAANAACTTWGGKNFDIIFLATASDREGNLSKDDQGGHMFRYKPTGSRGYPKGEFGA